HGTGRDRAWGGGPPSGILARAHEAEDRISKSWTRPESSARRAVRRIGLSPKRERQHGREDHDLDETHDRHEGELHGPGLQRLLLSETAHLADHPEAAVVHPGDRFRAEGDGSEDIELVE